MPINAFVLSLLLLSAPAFGNPNELNEKLHEAVQHQDTAAVAALLADGADPNNVNGIGFTPLIRAIKMGQADVVQQLLEFQRVLVGLALELAAGVDLCAVFGQAEVADRVVVFQAQADRVGQGVAPGAGGVLLVDGQALPRGLEHGVAGVRRPVS